MKIIVNKDIPEQAISKLRKYGDIITFSTDGITYPAISSHPDVFLFHMDNELIIAPNTPSEFKKKLGRHGITYTEGSNLVGNKYPYTASYNAVISNNYLIHNLNYTDPLIKKYCAKKNHIHVKQAYTRCNLLALNNDKFITSDKGIYTTLQANHIDVIYISPVGIELPGFDNGFFGGACGIINNIVFFMGELNYLSGGNDVHDFITHNSHSIVELYDGHPYDGGSIFFLQD